jgi:tetratricopeptide (TPR) repeat protein
MASNFRTCPQCSTRNRLDKEFCVKCGEPLEGVKAGDPAAAAAKKAKPGFQLSTTEAQEAQSPLVPLFLVFLTLGVGYAAWRTIQGTEPPAALAAAPPRPQASLPPPPAAPRMSSGAEQYTAGMAAMRAGNFPDAIRLLREAIAAANKADYRLGLAETLEKAGQTNDALIEYETAAGLDASNARYTSEWAKALNRAGRYTEAVATYGTALQIDPDNLSNLREVANIHLKASDFARARPHLEAIVRLQPDDLTPKQNLARALEATRDLEGAAKQYRDILAAMPDADMARALLSDVLMKQNQPDQAIALLEEGLQQDANSAVLYREKGRILDRLGRRADAVAAYQQYVRLAPGAVDVQVFTARIEQLSASGQ